MNSQQSAILCNNCFDTIEGSGVLADGKTYCCTGCAQGGPCICSYSSSLITCTEAAEGTAQQASPQSEGRIPSARAEDESNNAPSGPALREDIPTGPSISEAAQPEFQSPAANLGQLTENFLSAAENVRQAAATHREGDITTRTLGQVLRQAAQLLQKAADQLSGQPPSLAFPERVIRTGKTWESVQLTVTNVTHPAMVDQFASALEKLESVNEIMLLRVDGVSVHYQVWTTSNARFTREIMAVPGYRPLRVQASAERITLTLAPKAATTGEPDAVVVPMPQFSTEESQQPDTALAGEAGPTPEVVPLQGTNGTSTSSSLQVGTEAFFNARHYVLVDGQPGPVEMRSWRVEASLAGDQFDDNGALAGFDAVQLTVKQLLAGYNNKLLNNIQPFDHLSPTLENVARILYHQVKASIADQPLRLNSLKVWATPTQYALYFERASHAS
jgi:6-pyruvoyl-tetrahydropterin synthase